MDSLGCSEGKGCSCCQVPVGGGDVWAWVGAVVRLTSRTGVVSGVGLEEVTGQGWVVYDEAGPQGSTEGKEDQWFEAEVHHQEEVVFK